MTDSNLTRPRFRESFDHMTADEIACQRVLQKIWEELVLLGLDKEARVTWDAKMVFGDRYGSKMIRILDT